MIRVAIVADTRLYREGLAQVLGRDARVAVVATAARREEALASLPAVQPDVVLVDMAIPDSCGVVRAILARVSLARVVALGVVEDNDDVLGCAEAGVAGYVQREASIEDIGDGDRECGARRGDLLAACCGELAAAGRCARRGKWQWSAPSPPHEQGAGDRPPHR